MNILCKTLCFFFLCKFFSCVKIESISKIRYLNVFSHTHLSSLNWWGKGNDGIPSRIFCVNLQHTKIYCIFRHIRCTFSPLNWGGGGCVLYGKYKSPPWPSTSAYIPQEYSATPFPSTSWRRLRPGSPALPRTVFGRSLPCAIS